MYFAALHSSGTPGTAVNSTLYLQLKMMKQALLILVGIFLCLNLYAQPDYREGYMLTLTGDTLTGLINYRESKKSTKICEFKKDPAQEAATYGPADIRGYGFRNGKFHQSIEIKDKLNESKEAIFVEVLVRGTVSLYKDPSSFYIAKGDTTLHRLYIKEKDDFNKYDKDKLQYNRHIGLLTYMMYDCENVKLKEKIEHVQLLEQPLTELVETYNKCVSPSYVAYKSSKDWFRVNVGLSAAYRVSKLNFFSDELAYMLLTAGEYSSNNITAGALAEIVFPRVSEKLSFQVGAMFCNPVYAAYIEEQRPAETYRHDVTFTIKELKIPMSIQYRFPERKFTPFFNVGVASTLNLQADVLRKLEVVTKTETKNYVHRDFPFKDQQFGAWAGLGLERKIANKVKAYAEIRFERTNGIIDSKGEFGGRVTSQVDNLNFAIGIKR
ncbi:hypothetical protein D770_18255 [Flammeovirgaceae bacterium 311]|nr:hypothetical protein D770_18255 [Flammeovirgaceae bacterium 311]